MAVVVPTVGVVVLTATSPLASLIQFIIILGAVPIFAVYAGIAFWHYYPTRLIDAVIALAPSAVSLAYNTTMDWSFSVAGLPLYIGLYSVLLIGLARLFFNRPSLGGGVFFTLACTMVIGTTTLLAWPWLNWTLAIESLAIAVSFVPKLIELYRLNKL